MSLRERTRPGLGIIEPRLPQWLSLACATHLFSSWSFSWWSRRCSR